MFLKNLMNKAKNIVDETEQIDDHFYAQVMDELAQGFKDKGLVGKAIAQCDGQEGKFDSIYMKLRAKDLQDKFKQSLQQKSISSDKTLLTKKYKQGYFEQLFKNEIKVQGYYSAEVGDIHDFIKDQKEYRGKIDSHEMIYYLEDDNNEYEDSFTFKLV